MSVQSTAGANELPHNAVDPNIRVPASVRKAAQRSEELMKAMQGGDNQPAPENKDAQQPAPENKDAQQAQQPVQQAQQPAPENKDAQRPPVPWEDFNAMKGRYDRSQKDIVRLSDEVASLRNLIATMQAAPAQPAPAQPAPAELTAQSLITPKEIEDYGPEFIDLIGRKAKEIAGSEISQLKAKIESLEKGVTTSQQIQQQTSRQKLFEKLEQEVPNWNALNTDEKFIDWLRLPDAFSGVTRQELLNDAFAQNNASRVVAFFNGFLTEEAAVAPASASPPASVQPKVSLESLAAPGRAKSAPASPAAEKPIISRAQVAQFYADVAAGKYRGRDEDKAKAEAMIFNAQSEGRIR